ncbi:protein of unknown function DUF72 [Methylocella silvestris BL2]|uniref:DUF72 domain-containing protein n=1 Tax=Methylocella silvestris (strain DSM 15510 / CIP 108128 / LMG 27833 / NCIMB 13906 / BL2) TaxID=395965 RepID=B8EK91_METSB|nr:DUF72 domain-containing protein [Methylocella silvestris]ACK50631.1 protein of unknown function DUF72 [Methylocella silvestris BL2]
MAKAQTSTKRHDSSGNAGRIKVGVGGWSFPPWRDNFYPKGLPQAQELSFASRKLTAIEVNATFYRTQTPQSFRRWAEETPEDFVFSLKAHRLATHRKSLAECAPAIEHFLGSGLAELGDKLGPIVWQFAPFKQFDADDFERFCDALPKALDGRPLRHVLEVRHESFRVAAFVALARRYACAICLADSSDYPLIPDLTAGFVYARLQQSAPDCATGYDDSALRLWADRASLWLRGKQPADLAGVSDAAPEKRAARDVFIYFIAGAKEKNPAAALALIERLAAE